MIVFPAIDLRQGRCVRLYQGDPTQETVFSDDPVATAGHWVDEGAGWLHVVNLDGALGEQNENMVAVRQIVEALGPRGVRVQFGGGLRALEDVDEALSWGVARVILGTVALQDPETVRAAVTEYGPARVAVGIDARDGRVAIEGWQQTTEIQVLDFAQQLKDFGVQRVIYTDIGRDGTQQGPNIARTGELAQKSGLKVIASGGVGRLDHLRQIRWIEPYGVEGVIVGRALYEKNFTLDEAREMLGDESNQ